MNNKILHFDVFPFFFEKHMKPMFDYKLRRCNKKNSFAINDSQVGVFFSFFYRIEF